MSQARSELALAPMSLAWPRLLAPLLALELGLVAAYLLTSTHVLGQQMAIWFDLDREPGVGAWFSSSQLLIVALILTLTQPTPTFPAAPSGWFLRLLAVGFLFLSIDEAVSVHEAISVSVRRRLPELQLGWMPLYAAIGAAGVLLTLPQLLRMWRAHRECASLFLTGVVVFAGGAALLELVGFFRLLPDMRLQVVMEEFAEMAGVSLILCAALELRRRLEQERLPTDRRRSVQGFAS